MAKKKSRKTHKRQWRFYRTAGGSSPVEKFLEGVPTNDRAEIAAEMAVVRSEGKKAARHLQGDLYEVRVQGQDVIYRVIFAALGRYQHVLLAVHSFVKKTQKTPKKEIDVANKRLADWQSRGDKKKGAKEKKT